MTEKEKEFVELVWDFYDKHARRMPWREADENGEYDPYKILVSEIMLQQTQVDRVIPKYNEFIKQFSNCEKLANSRLKDVLAVWSGLGYNRRAKYLHEAAKELQGKPFPTTINNLMQLKGVGHNTAAAVLTYSCNQQYAFIETNVRTVYIHHFFAEDMGITDEQILEVVQRTIDVGNPREFMWAVMDYGAYLKKQGFSHNTKSKYYTKQTVFKGSKRQLRGEVLRQAQQDTSILDLKAVIVDERLDDVLLALQEEGLIVLKHARVIIP